MKGGLFGLSREDSDLLPLLVQCEECVFTWLCNSAGIGLNLGRWNWVSYVSLSPTIPGHQGIVGITQFYDNFKPKQFIEFK